jgi:hypothetical protein
MAERELAAMASIHAFQSRIPPDSHLRHSERSEEPNAKRYAKHSGASTRRVRWEEVHGFDPQTDPLYKLIIRSLRTQ